MLRYLVIILFLGIIPVVLGMPWTKVIQTKYKIAFSYGFGFFIELCLFHVIAFVATYAYIRFHVVVWIYSISIVLLSITSSVYCVRNGIYKDCFYRAGHEKYNWLEWILFIFIISTIGFQLYCGFTCDLTYMSYDDSHYTAIATDTAQTDVIGMVDAYTGEARRLFAKRAIQTSLVFPSYLSAISGVSVAVMEHTIQYEQMIILCYAINLFLAGLLFNKRENQLIFILVISVFYIYGYHSHYSLTFRLLGPNYQGKAILAVSLTPLVFGIYVKKLAEPYNWKIGAMLAILSVSAVSLTLWGIGTIVVIVSLPVLISMIRKGRDWKHLIYIAWAAIAPACFLMFYMIAKIKN